jgi:hypothetical protein
MAYKLAISSLVLVPMLFTMNDEGKTRQFKFSLTCERLEEEDFQERIKSESGIPSNDRIKEVITGITTGWKEQTMVLDDDGQPAAFCQEALEFMFKTPGVVDVALRSYLKEVGAKVKN